MTYDEFSAGVPHIIENGQHGRAYLERIDFGKGDKRKGIVYKHGDKTSSYGTIGDNWQAVYDHLMPKLKQDGIDV